VLEGYLTFPGVIISNLSFPWPLANFLPPSHHMLVCGLFQFHMRIQLKHRCLCLLFFFLDVFWERSKLPRSTFLCFPIILGVLISSVTELDFNFLGLISALFSIFIFSLQNIYSKKVLKETSIHHLRLLHVLSKHALIMFIPFWFYHDLLDILYESKDTTLDGWIISGLLFVDGMCNFFQNVIAFTVLSLVTPLTYSVCNASKRIAVITCSILLLKNPVTPFNIFGMSLAIFGVFYYNKAKIDSRNEPILPTKTLNKTTYNGLKSKSSETNLLLRYVDSNDHISNSILAPKSSFSPSLYTDQQHNGYHYRGNKSTPRHTNGESRNQTGIDMMDV